MQVAEEIKEIVSRQLGVDPSEVKEGASFTDDLGADSLAIVELVLAIEEHFKIDIPEKETERMRTVGDAVAYVKAQKQAS